jgi:hypothetical protein
MRLDVDRRHQKHARREISEANVSDLDLDALEALLKEAPHPGEWKATSGGTLRTDDASIDYPPCVRSHWKDEQERRCQRIIAESDNEADVSLIAALYNAAPELIAEARKARRLREGIRDFRERCNKGGPHSLNDFLRISCGLVVAVLDGILEPVVSTEEPADA